MNDLFSVLVSIVVFAFIITKVAKSSKKASAKGKRAPAAPRYTNYRPHKDITSVSRDMSDKRGNSVLRDDKNNDWLARQLRDEHKAFKATSEMFDLKIEHASHCDARLIEQYHRRNCSASGIDLANGSTVSGR